MRRPLTFIAFLCILCLPLVAQAPDTGRAIADWYGRHPRAGLYESIRAEITATVAAGGVAGIPAVVLIEILDEAAAKSIPPPRLLAALKSRTDDLIRIAGSLERSRECLTRSPGGDGYSPPALLTQCAGLLRRGISPDVIEAMLQEACRRSKNVTATFDALRTLANIPSLGELSREKAEALGNAILGSGLSPTGYTALSSMYIKGKLKNLNTREITDIIITALNEGKGLIRIEQELDRRGGQ